MRFSLVLAVVLLSLPALAKVKPKVDARPASPNSSQLPAKLRGKAVILKSTDTDYRRANLTEGVKPAGGGGLVKGIVVKLTADVTIYRLYNGPAYKDARGNNNRLGQWWTYDPPKGTQAAFRKAYAVCKIWNEVTWVTACKLRKGAVVAVGPGNSASPGTCASDEDYPVNQRDWQIWIDKAWEREGKDSAGNLKEIGCPSTSADYLADVTNIARPMKKGTKAPAKKPASSRARN